MDEQKFSEIWDYVLKISNLLPVDRENLKARRDLGREAYEVLCFIAPSLAANQIIAASWVHRLITIGRDSLANLDFLRTISHIELNMQWCKLLEVTAKNEQRDLTDKLKPS